METFLGRFADRDRELDLEKVVIRRYFEKVEYRDEGVENFFGGRGSGGVSSGSGSVSERGAVVGGGGGGGGSSPFIRYALPGEDRVEWQ